MGYLGITRSLFNPSIVVLPLSREVEDMLQALPTEVDLKAIFHQLEETHKQDLQLIQSEVQQLTDQVSIGETSTATLEQRVVALEQDQASHTNQIVPMQMLLEDQRLQNNLQLWNIPEAVGPEHLHNTGPAILHKALDIPIPSNHPEG